MIDAEMTPAELQELGKKWMVRIRDAEKREDDWHRDATAAEKAFLAARDSDDAGKCYDFNILHSNVETIVPAIYNSTPHPDIRERYRTGGDTPETQVARLVAQVFERCIATQIDDGRLDSEIEGAAQDAFLAGRGITRIRFDADEQPGEPMLDPMTGEVVMGQPSVVNERIVFEAVNWRDYREGPAQRWRDVPWIAFRHMVAEEEIERIADPELKEKLGGARNDADAPALMDPTTGDVALWEIWCREDRTVKMLVEASEEIIAVQDDPLGLPAFFPMPEPIQPIMATGRRKPVCPWSVYRELGEELERITKRINAIVSGLKVKGAFAGAATDIEALAKAGDNELIPVANLEAMAQTGGIDKAIMWWPIDTAVAVLRELYVAREQTKQMIYEVTGISDIIRGQGTASETATAQNIKTQWGSLRIKKLQRLIERHIRDLFVLCAEVLSTKFSPETLTAMSGIQLPQEAMALINAPLDHYRIDVESDSTVRADLTQRREEMGRFLEGTGAFFNVMAPLIAQAPTMAGPVAEMYAAFARQFSLGKQAEDAIEQMAEMARQQAQAAQEQPSPQDQAMQAQQEAAQQQMAMEQQKLEMEAQEAAAELQIKQVELQIKQAELTLKERQMEIEGVKALAEMEADDMDRDFNREQTERDNG